MENLCQSGVRTSDCSATLIHSCLRRENKLIKYQFEVFRPWNDLKSLVKESLGLKLCLWGIIFNLAVSSDGLFFKLPIVRMPMKKVLLWDCLCLGLAFISFLMTDDSAFRSSNHSLVPLGAGADLQEGCLRWHCRCSAVLASGSGPRAHRCHFPKSHPAPSSWACLRGLQIHSFHERQCHPIKI